MEAKYYIIWEGHQIGPMQAEELLRYGLNEGSIVWHPGLSDWERAANVPELAYLIGGPEPEVTVEQQERPVPPGFQQGPTPNYGPQPQNYGAQPQPSSYYGGYPQQPKPEYSGLRSKWMTASIIATVLGFLFSCIGGILGVVGIIQASNANNAFRRGDNIEGDRLDANAKTWTIVSFVITGLGFLACIVYFILIFFVGVARAL